jgi:phosphate transport system substrate-binding protein
MHIPVLIILMLGLVSSANADTLRVGGLGAATKLLPVLSARFADKNANAALEVIPSLGSSGGLRALAEGVLDMAVSGRPLNAEELKQGLHVAMTIRTPFVMVTSHDKPDGIRSAEIEGIYRNQKAKWSDGSAVRVILRPKSDSDTPLLGGMFPAMVSALEAARARHDVTVAATDQDNADAAERIPGSLTGSTLTQIKTEERRLRMIPIDGVVPTLETLESGAYPFSKTIYFVLPAKKNPLAENLVTFLHSPAGEAALRDGGTLLVLDQSKS